MVVLSIMLGDVFRAFNPWRAIARAAGAIFRVIAGQAHAAPFEYPERLGVWPAAVLFFAVATMELVYPTPADPPAVGAAVAIYSIVTWTGMLLFGRRAWLDNGDAFNVYFGLLSRISPFGVRRASERREVVVRRPLSALAEDERRAGTVAFVAVMLGSVGFDGFSRTRRWQNFRFEHTKHLAFTNPQLADLVSFLLNLAGLVAAVLVVGCAYLLAVRAAEAAGRTRNDLAPVFVLSLVPIALVYVVAHYFSLFVVQGQVAIPLLSDPLGRGWDLFGTSGFQVNLRALTPNEIWYTQVVALVLGHVAGLVIAHDRAVQLFGSARTALRTQYAMLALMVVYTVGGMWILSQP
jgi:hypothetical protein